MCTWSLRAQPKELLCVADVRKYLTSRVRPSGQGAAEEDMRSNRGRGLSPTLSGSQSRARLCVNAAKIVGGGWSPFGRVQLWPSFMFLFATHPRLGDVHRNRSTLLQPLPHIGFLCKEKVANVPLRIREMKTAADTDSVFLDFWNVFLRSFDQRAFLQLARHLLPVWD